MPRTSTTTGRRRPAKVAAACVCAALALISLDITAQSSAPATQAMAVARRAVAATGAGPLVGLRIIGTLSVNNTDGSKASYPVELRFVISSAYLRIERQSRFVQQSGFDGHSLLNDLKPYTPSSQVVIAYPADQIDSERARSRRLLLGIAAVVESESQPTSVEASVIDKRAVELVSLADSRLKNLAVGLGRIDHMPLVVVSTQAVILPVKPGEPLSSPPPPRVVQTQQWFEDRRDVNGYRLPFLIRMVAGDVELERLVVDRIQVNPIFGPADFVK